MRGPMNKPAQVPFNVQSLDVHKCHKCDSTEFVRIALLRRVPAVLSPTGAPILIPEEKMARCAACGEPALWKQEDQPKIVIAGGDGSVRNVPLEGNVPAVDEGGQKE